MQTLSLSFLPRIDRFEKQLALSIAAHVLFFAGGLGLQMLSERRAVKPVEIEMEYLTPAPSAVAPAPAKGETIAVGGAVSSTARARGRFAGLLAQATKGAASKASGVRAPEAASTSARGATRGLLAEALAETKAGRAGLKTGALAHSASIPWESVGADSGSSRALTAVETAQIRKIIAAREEAFRSCHEKALLVDGALSGQANLVFSVAGTGLVGDTNVGFEGGGSGASLALLKSCLRAESRQLRFPVTVASSQIKFSLLLR